MVLILNSLFSFRFVVPLASLFSLTLVKNISRKVVSIPFDFIKGIHLVLDTLCEAEVLCGGFEMRTEIKLLHIIPQFR